MSAFFARAILVLLVVVIGSAGAANAQSAAPNDDASERAHLEDLSRSSNPAIASDALYRLAEIDDAALDFASAVARYDASVAKLPSNRHAGRAIARADTLRKHAEGGFAPYVELERLRRSSAAADDPTALEALARHADAWPPGYVRGEARMLVAEAYLGRLRRPADAVPLLRAVADDASADPVTARQARRMLVDTLVALGDPRGAAEAARVPGADPALDAAVSRVVWRRRLHLASIGVVGFFALAVAAALARAAAARAKARTRAPAVREARGGRDVVAFARLAAPYAAWTALAGGALASTYESGNARPFLVLGAVVLVVALLARAWGVVGSGARAARAGRAAAAAATVFAAAFLVLEAVDTTYLDGFGL